jgi:hypothetical protein
MVACIFVFVLLFFLSFRLRQEAKIKVSNKGKWRPFVSFNGGVGLFFNCFSSTFRSQIYSTPLFFSRHAPLSNVHRRRPLLLPEA